MADERNPGANRLAEELEGYIEARLEKALTGMGHRVGDAAGKLGTAHIGPRSFAHAVGQGGKKLGEHIPGSGALTSATSHVKHTAAHVKDTAAHVKGTASHVKDTASHAKDTAAHTKDALVGKAKTVTGDKGAEPAKPSGGGHKSLTVIEDIDIGVPVRETYNQWTQFQEFSRFAKGVVDVEQEDDTTTQWEVKIAKASRSWKGSITEQIPDERIAWTSEGPKGTTKGVVTFHPLGENLTKVLLVMEYFPKGVVEKAGSLLRAQGRRARLDLKEFRKFVMMRGEATGGWRGEIHGGEVVAGPDEESDRPEDEGRYEDEDREAEQDEGEAEGEEEYEEEEPEDRYEDEEEYEEEEPEDR